MVGARFLGVIRAVIHRLGGGLEPDECNREIMGLNHAEKGFSNGRYCPRRYYKNQYSGVREITTIKEIYFNIFNGVKNNTRSIEVPDAIQTIMHRYKFTLHTDTRQGNIIKGENLDYAN